MSLTKAYLPESVSKLTIEFAPISTPGVCGSCGISESKDGFVNTGLDFEFWGTLIFCRNCVSEMASIYGLISPEVAEDYQLEKDLLIKEVEVLREALTSSKGIIDGFSNGWLSSRANDIISSPVITEPKPGKEHTIPKFRIQGEQREAAELSSVEGLPNI
jgi:hypothetical protein